MEDAIDLVDYLPISFKSAAEQDYISFLWDTFTENYDSGKHQFAFLAYHMLMMSFVYFKIWKIKSILSEDYNKGVIGYNKDDEQKLLNATSPFEFSMVGESRVLRLLRLIGCDNSQIGNCTRLVKDRNEIAHANGHTYYSTRSQLDDQVRKVLRSVQEIQSQSSQLVTLFYNEFLEVSCEIDDREYTDDVDQIREVLIHNNYLSIQDIQICMEYDILGVDHENATCVQALHQTLLDTFGQ